MENPEPTAPPQRRQTPLRILVVDDEPAILSMFKDTFALFEANARDAATGQETPDEPIAAHDLMLCGNGQVAIEAVQKGIEENRPYAVAFIDVNMPQGLGGVETAERIRALDPNIHFVIITGFSDIGPQSIAERVGPLDRLLYLQKPLHPLEIQHFTAALGAKWQIEKMQRKIAAAERRHAETQTQLERQALHDRLTGLPNRALFLDRIQRLIVRAQRQGNYRFALLFLDLDRFKTINDTLGHMIGDELLVAVSRRFAVCLRDGDSIARFGGDEFTILLDDIKEAAEAERVAERINQTLARPFILSGHKIGTSASIGIVLSEPGFNRAEDLMERSDTAMYRAKALGKGRYVLFDQSMHNHAVAMHQLEMDLRRAVKLGQFQTFYQPSVALETGRIVGFEALLRWEHPSRGLLRSAEFINQAEDIGLLPQIGQRVIEQACIQGARWQRERAEDKDLGITVNLSAAQVLQRDLVDIVAAILADSGFNPSSLVFEVRESVLMENAESVVETLRRLKALGIRLRIDNFGSGFSSLRHLHRLPLDALKIDSAFIATLGIKSESAEIVRTIIGLAHSLHLAVTGEGIETTEQLEHLRDMRCEFGQGFLFSPPVNAECAGALLAAGPLRPNPIERA